MSKGKINAHCPVPYCKATRPHRQDKYVDALMRITELPHLMCAYVSEGLGQLGNSACNDLANRNALGFLTRQRQIQELYIKTLYLLLIADPLEQEHMVSGEMPNGMSPLYRRVNELIFHKQTDWEATTAGLNGDEFTIMETLHDGAHVSFRSLLMARSYFDHPELVMTPERFAEYIRSLATRLKYMHGMFQAGKPRGQVLDGVQALYRPNSYWEEQQRIAKANASEG
jgi:hypothetical protein